MSFLFVDDITAMTERTIRGRLALDGAMPFRYALANGAEVLAPGVVCEAIGQLASWLLLSNNNFTSRPLFVFADRITVHRQAPIGSQLELEARVHYVDGESARFSGTASAGGVILQTVKDCMFAFKPLAELEDPDICRNRFVQLRQGAQAAPRFGGKTFSWSHLRGETLALIPKTSIHQRIRLDPDHDFYRDHFPRFPVTPAVILNEMIAQALVAMMEGTESVWAESVISIQSCKIRDFIRPGQTIEVKAKRIDHGQNPHDPQLKALIEIFVEQRRIMHATWCVDELSGLG